MKATPLYPAYPSLAGDAGLQRRFATTCSPYGVSQSVRSDIFEQVARGSGLDRSEDEFVVIEGRQHQHLHSRPALLDTLRRRHAIHARHAQVHQDDIRLKLGGQLLRFVTVASFADYAQVTVELEQRPQALAHHALVVDQQSPNRVARVFVLLSLSQSGYQGPTIPPDATTVRPRWPAPPVWCRPGCLLLQLPCTAPAQRPGHTPGHF